MSTKEVLPAMATANHSHAVTVASTGADGAAPAMVDYNAAATGSRVLS